MDGNKSKLKQITEILLREEDSFGEIKEATDELYKFFLEISNVDENEEKHKEQIYLPEGKAIGTIWAAMCVKEFMRTKKFVRGIYLAIKEAQKRFSNATIHILYAGTGPFAALAVPMTTVFTSKEIQFTLLEINEGSIHHLKNTIEALGIQAYIKEIVKCDAARYDSKKHMPYHIVMTETMLNALQKEPQVAITMNLIDNLEENGILIPENIRIEAVLIDTKRNMDRMMGLSDGSSYYHSLKNIFELNKEINKKADLKKLKVEGKLAFPKVEVEIPEGIPKEYNQLYLFTEIKVFGGEVLTHWQCSLNLPLRLSNVDIINKRPKNMSFNYVISDKPGFEYAVNSYAEK